MSNEVTFTGKVEGIKRVPVAQSATGDVLFYRYTVKVGTLATSGDDVNFEFSAVNYPGDPIDALVRVTVRFPEDWEVQA